MTRMKTRFLYGYLYVLESSNLYKIGYSFDPDTRLRRLQTGSATPLTVVHLIRTPHFRELEKKLHRRFAAKRIHGEWYALDNADIEYMARLDGFGMTAEDREKRERDEAEFYARPLKEEQKRERAELNAFMGKVFSDLSEYA